MFRKLKSVVVFLKLICTLQVSLLNTIKTNKIIRIFKTQELHLHTCIYCSSWFIEYPLYPVACWLPYLRSSVYKFLIFSTSEAHVSASEFVVLSQ